MNFMDPPPPPSRLARSMYVYSLWVEENKGLVANNGSAKVQTVRGEALGELC